MQVVTLQGTTYGRHDVCRGNGLGQAVDGVVGGATNTVLVFIAHLASNERHVFGIKVEFCEQVLIHLFHFLQPHAAVGIVFPLMQEDTFDDTALLCFPGTFKQTPQGIAAVSVDSIDLPTLVHCSHIRLPAVGIVQININAADGYHHNTHALAFVKVRHHGAAKIIGRAEMGVTTCQRRDGAIPLSELAGSAVER